MFLEMIMVNLILFLLAAVGLTNILIYGSILDNAREWVLARVPDKVGEVLSCYQCTGFWSGLLTGYVLLTHDFFGTLMCGFAGSFTSHFAAVLVEYLEANSMVSVPHSEEGVEDHIDG
jgi:hypothetical protein